MAEGGRATIDQQTQKPYRYEVVGLCSIGVILLAVAVYFLRDSPPPGWDLLGHYYLFIRARDYLLEGSISGYNPLWFGGYGEFLYYAPGVHMALGLFSIVLEPLLSPHLVFRLLVGAFPLFFLGAMGVASFILAGRRGVFPGVLFGFAFIAQDPRALPLGIGLPGLFGNGLIGSFLALALLAIYIALLAKPNRVRRGWIALAALLGAIAWTHHLSFLIAVGCALVRCVSCTRHLTHLIASLALGGMLALPSVYPLWRDGTHLSGTFLSYTMGWRLLSDIAPGVGDLVTFLFGGGKAAATASAWSLFSLPTLILPIAVCYSAYRVWTDETQRFFLLLLTVGLLAVSLSPFLPPIAPIHAYRLIAPVAVVLVLMASIFWCEVLEPRVRGWAQVVLCGAVLLCILPHALLTVALFRDPVVRDGTRLYTSLEQYPRAAEGRRVMEVAASSVHRGRILAESPSGNFRRLGSPHYFSVLLPLLYEKAVFQGLLAESSPVFPFMQSLLRARSASLNWASPSDVLREPTAIETDALFSLFSIYGIRTVVSSSSPFAEFLDTVSRLPHPPVTSVERVGSFRVAQLVASSPLVSELLTRPWGWISGNGPTMREVMQEGLRFPGLFERTFYLMTSDLPRAGLDGVVAVGEVPGRVEALLNAGLPCVQIVTAPERGHPRCDLITGSSPGEIAERLDGWFGERVGYRLRPVRRVQFRKGSLSYWARRPTRVAFGFSPLLRGYKEQSRGRWRQIPLYMTNHGLTGVLARGRIKVCFGRCPQGGQRR